MVSLSVSLQVLLVSTGVLSIALLLKVPVPLALNFSAGQALNRWTSLSSWLKTPYIYIIMNCIIITIVAFSRLYQNHEASTDQEVQMPTKTKSMRHLNEFEYQVKVPTAMEVVESTLYERREDKAGVFEDTREDDDDDDDGYVTCKSTSVPPEGTDSFENLPPIVSPDNRKPFNAMSEGRRASKRHETLENTWKMITEGRQIPLTSTWENEGRQENVRGMKSKTLKDRTNYELSQDELNQRVEAFIMKFNEEMRLQRQQSLNQHKEMISY